MNSNLTLSNPETFVYEDLDTILENAPIEVVYKPHNNGFELENETIRIGYVQISFLSRDIVYLWFLNTYPKVKVESKFVNMNELPNSLICTSLCLHMGDTHSFSFPAEPDDDTIIDTFSIVRNPHLLFLKQKRYPEEWFDNGSRLLVKATKRYNLREYYQKYIGKDVEISSKPKSLIERVYIRLRAINDLINS